jgi:hypothetical protein
MSGDPEASHIATQDEIGQEKQRVSERLARLDTERARLADQSGVLEIAERVLTQLGKRAVRAERRRRGGLATTAPEAGGERSARGTRQMGTVALRDAVLKAVGGTFPRRHRERGACLRVTGIRLEGQAEPSRCAAAPTPPRRSARTSGPALVPAAFGVIS